MIAVLAIHWMKDLANSRRLKSGTPFDSRFIGPFAGGRSLLSAVVYSFDSQRIVATCLFDAVPINKSCRWKARVLRTTTDLGSSTSLGVVCLEAESVFSAAMSLDWRDCSGFQNHKGAR